MKKVYMCPTPSQARKDDTNSIHQIVLHLERELPQCGYEITENANEADLKAGHAGQTYGFDDVEVAHCHGLYPTYHYPEKRHFGVNMDVIKHLQSASAITVPSEWVADIIRREMNINPIVINWGIEANKWQNTSNQKFTLWNKTRVSDVCDPTPLIELAKAYPDNQFVSTFANNPTPNLNVIGRMPFAQMKQYIENCGVYLATTKETFGIGILEAMACGKPILGYDWGAVPTIVKHGVTGFLAKPNDIQGLIEGLKWIWKNYQVLSENCQIEARQEKYTWSHIAKRFANVYDLVLQKKNTVNDCPVSVVIPCFNYGQHIEKSILSMVSQETSFNYEVIVIDDCSTDGSSDVCANMVDHYKAQGANIRFIRNKTNLGVAETRNKAISASYGDYITCLDADDKINTTNFLQTLYDFLQANPDVGVTYSGLALFTIDGGIAKKSDFPPDTFDIKQQLSGRNQVPTCNMFKKEAWYRAGGYRKYQQPAEDAALWLSMAMLGYNIKKATKETMFMYRWHEDSLSSPIRRGESSEPYWRRQWHSAIDHKPPFVSIQKPDNDLSHPVANYDTPLVSIIIPVGKGHELEVIRAIDSVQGQTFINYECIVINDTGDELYIPHVWAKVYNTSGKRGAGRARNIGIEHAKGEFIVFLDADDLLLPEFLDETIKAYQRHGKYIYTDWFGQRGKALTQTPASEYAQDDILHKSSIHAITSLIPKVWINEVGGFDETMISWEDSDFFMKLAVSGFCGKRLNKPLFIYNYDTGKRREVGVSQKPELVAEINKRFERYRNGETPMCKCTQDLIKRHDVDFSQAVQNGEMIRIEMVAGSSAKTHIIGDVTKTAYGRRQVGESFYMYIQDVQAKPDTYKPISNAPLQISTTEFPDRPMRIR